MWNGQQVLLHQQDDIAASVYEEMPRHYLLCILDICLRQCCGLLVLHVLMLLAGRTVLSAHAVHSTAGHLYFAVCAVMLDAPAIRVWKAHVGICTCQIPECMTVLMYQLVAKQALTLHQLLVQVQCRSIQQLCNTCFLLMAIALFMDDWVLNDMMQLIDTACKSCTVLVVTPGKMTGDLLFGVYSKSSWRCLGNVWLCRHCQTLLALHNSFLARIREPCK